MEFEGLSEEVEWECRRIVMAYELTSFQSYGVGSSAFVYVPSPIYFRGTWEGNSDTALRWTIDGDGPTLLKLSLDRDVEFCLLARDEEDKHKFVSFSYAQRDLKQVMARGLYRLGIEDEDALGELNSVLSAHEKVELRLSMTREFWSQAWLDEVGD